MFTIEMQQKSVKKRFWGGIEYVEDKYIKNRLTTEM